MNWGVETPSACDVLWRLCGSYTLAKTTASNAARKTVTIVTSFIASTRPISSPTTAAAVSAPMACCDQSVSQIVAAVPRLLHLADGDRYRGGCKVKARFNVIVGFDVNSGAPIP